MPSRHAEPPAPPVSTRSRLRAEVFIVLGLSLGYHAVVSVWLLASRYVSATPVGEQTEVIVGSVSDSEVMDAIGQLIRLSFGLVPLALALFLLSTHGVSARARLGLTWGGTSKPRMRTDLGRGALLAAAIGLPGIGLYVLGRALGQNVALDLSGLPPKWWAALVLILAALSAALVEEIVGVGYLVTRLRELAWSTPAAIAASALLRGTYHLYQGWPMALGNAVMGAVFATYFVRTGRVGPLIAAHAIMDVLSFVGPEVLPDSWLSGLRLA